MIQRGIVRRQSSLAAAKRILAQADDEPDNEPLKAIARTRRAAAKPPPSPPVAAPAAAAATRKDASEADFTPAIDDDEVNETVEPPPKRRKVEKTRKTDTTKLYASLFGPSGQATQDPCSPPSRTHAASYHRPLLLDGQSGRDGRDALLAWFDATSTTRGMPWRKAWIDPRAPHPDGDAGAGLRAAFERRAYEVWISEIMLQQTRVAVVIDYWNRWMSRWPTIQDLAAAAPEDVLSAWRGLGYYSRATRIHDAAKLVVADPGWAGLMPADTAELEAKVPGVGRYTAGAIAAIVFGRAAPMVDGNVLRVLSRQLGVFGNAKTDKAVIDLLWAAADALVKAVARDGPENDRVAGDEDEDTSPPPTSDRPGRWGQALMELGSTVCTPKPNCGACPITSTCRAYAEGLLVAAKPRRAAKVEDMEDMCSICEPFEEAAALSGEDSDAEAPKPVKGAKEAGKGTKSRPVAKQATLSAFFPPSSSSSSSSSSSKTAKKKEEETASPGPRAADARTLEIVAEHARKFPLKVVKKARRALPAPPAPGQGAPRRDVGAAEPHAAAGGGEQHGVVAEAGRAGVRVGSAARRRRREAEGGRKGEGRAPGAARRGPRQRAVAVLAHQADDARAPLRSGRGGGVRVVACEAPVGHGGRGGRGVDGDRDAQVLGLGEGEDRGRRILLLCQRPGSRRSRSVPAPLPPRRIQNTPRICETWLPPPPHSTPPDSTALGGTQLRHEMDPRPFGFRCGYGGAVPSLVRAHNLLQFLCSHPRATSQPPPPLQQAFARLAQSVERETLNLKVVGSTPTSGSIPVSD
ncbi:putative A/G-specific adenine glycosylase [Colletotrichum sublineola]|uniref:Adenine DNA glycosylase n=1 Tax=Colletotrichum sublineola TaxID=1173701 RepID=A0A066X1H5_COLSU|nr:putative A/G-specific adenine glycosylase [Colletotrichum sublineola]